MVYLFESNIPENSSVIFALKHIYGIGENYSILIQKRLGFSKNLKMKDLTKEQIVQLVRVIESLDLELASDLKKAKALRHKALTTIKSYRGLRKTQGYPVRGQRTHTNARTSKRVR